MALSENELKIVKAIDDNAREIIQLGKTILSNPELGYKEFETSRIIKEKFNELSLETKSGLAVTGVKATVGNKDKFNVCLIGELDSVMCYGHPYCNNDTGAAHACGHHAQIAALYGAACGIMKSKIMDELSGAVTFFAVPAEEYIDLDYRRSLKDEGKIRFFGGKQQLIYEGEFDDIDAAVMVHANAETPDKGVYIHGSSLGFLGKKITFSGRAVHASTPFDGVNALNAAALAILGMHTNRERFRDEDKIRVHPIITKGGDVVNSVPDDVQIDTYVRGARMDAITSASHDTDRAAKGAAQIVGAEVNIETTAGYLPLKQDYNLGEVFKEVSLEFMDEKYIHSGIDMTGSSDIGDVSQLIPTIQPSVGGFTGQLHSKEFCETNDEIAYLIPAKIMAITAYRLLENDAKLGLKIKEDFKPLMNKKEYITALENSEC